MILRTTTRPLPTTSIRYTLLDRPSFLQLFLCCSSARGRVDEKLEGCVGNKNRSQQLPVLLRLPAERSRTSNVDHRVVQSPNQLVNTGRRKIKERCDYIP